MVPPCSNNMCAFARENDCIGQANCMWVDGACHISPCASLERGQCSSTRINGVKVCEFNSVLNSCERAMCTGANNKAQCEKDTRCTWKSAPVIGAIGRFEESCHIKSEQDFLAGNAADDAGEGECTEVEKSFTALAVIMPILTLLLAGSLAWIVMRQRRAGAGGDKSAAGKYGFGASGGLGDKMVEEDEEEMEAPSRPLQENNNGDDLGEL